MLVVVQQRAHQVDHGLPVDGFGEVVVGAALGGVLQNT